MLLRLWGAVLTTIKREKLAASREWRCSSGDAQDPGRTRAKKGLAVAKRGGGQWRHLLTRDMIFATFAQSWALIDSLLAAYSVALVAIALLHAGHIEMRCNELSCVLTSVIT